MYLSDMYLSHASFDILVSAACFFVHTQVSFVSLFAHMQVFIQT